MTASGILYFLVRRAGQATVIGALLLAFQGASVAVAEGPRDWRLEFPITDFERHAIAYDEILFDGASRDSIPPIDHPRFVPVSEITGVGALEPVLSIAINGDLRAYPLRLLLWHEIVNDTVNDTVGGVPVLVSYGPPCNSGVVFERRLEGRLLEFGNTGRLRHFDMVMYDKQTESCWQQFLGEALIGELTGKRLKLLPARLESLSRFKARAPGGKLLVPDDDGARPYGRTPYFGMDSRALPRGRFPYYFPAVVAGSDW